MINFLLAVIAGLLALGTGLQIFFAQQIVSQGRMIMSQGKRLSALEAEHNAIHRFPVEGGRRDYDRPVMIECTNCKQVSALNNDAVK